MSEITIAWQHIDRSTDTLMMVETTVELQPEDAREVILSYMEDGPRYNSPKSRKELVKKHASRVVIEKTPYNE